VMDGIDMGDEGERACGEAGFLQQFAPRADFGGLAQLLLAAGERPCALAGQAAAFDEQDFVPQEQDDADADLGGRGVGSQSRSWIICCFNKVF
jgi:hypothetical protein